MTTIVSASGSVKKATNLATLHQQMRTALLPWISFPEPQWKLFATIFRIRTVQEREFVLFPGVSIDELMFVCSGLLRAYYVGDDGAESNKAFIAENEFAGPLPAAAVDTSIIYGIQTLEPTTMLVAHYADFVAFVDQHPVFSQFQRKLTEWILSRKEVRMRNLLQGNARTKYLDFIQRHPQLAQRVPQYHIASYLGITEVHLSRLRKTLADERAS